MSEIGPITSTPRVTDYVDYLGDEPEPPPPPKPRRKKMTKAERMELQRKNEIEFRKLEMKEHLNREVVLAKQSFTKGKQMWFQMCKQIKLDQMQKDLKAWQERANSVLKAKDESIKLLLNEIETKKQMHKRGFLMQMDTLDYLKDIFNAFQKNLHFRYEKQCQDMVHDFCNKTCEITEIQEAYVHKFHTKLNDTNESLEMQVFEDFHKSVEKRDDIVNDEIITKYIIRDSTQNKMYSIHNQLGAFVDALLNASFDVLQFDKVKDLMEQQENFVTDSKNLNETETRKSKKLDELQKQLAEMDADDKRKINDLTQVHAYYKNESKSIETRMERDRVESHEKLICLTSECYANQKSLEKFKKYGELLLSLSANCRKLQTESEKVTLLSDLEEISVVEQKDELQEFKLKIIDLKGHMDLSEDEVLAQMRLMKHFWRRSALVEGQTVLLEEKKCQLLIENQQYRDKIKALRKAKNVDDLQQALKVESILVKRP